MAKSSGSPNRQKKQQESLQNSISRILRVSMFESGINNIKELSIATGIAYDRLWREITGKNDWFLWDLYICSSVLSLTDAQKVSLLSLDSKR